MLQELMIHLQCIHIVDIELRVTEMVCKVDSRIEKVTIRQIQVKPLVTTHLGHNIALEAANTVTVERNVVTPMKAFEIFAKPNAVPDYQWYIDAVGDEYYINRPEELLALSKLSNGDSYALSVTGEDAPVTFESSLKSIYRFPASRCLF